MGVSGWRERSRDVVDLCLLFWEGYEVHGMMRLSPQKLPKNRTTAKGVSGELRHTKRKIVSRRRLEEIQVVVCTSAARNHWAQDQGYGG